MVIVLHLYSALRWDQNEALHKVQENAVRENLNVDISSLVSPVNVKHAHFMNLCSFVA